MTEPSDSPGKRPDPEDLARLRAAGTDPGLCATCRNARILHSRTSTFLRCALAEADPHFPRYPRLPVLACRGYDPLSPR
ncbi:MAG TPA: hypothetical protein VLF66_14670 [Thermoanaerobaculia bacterium]|nr:hypothetical protein [Thermoanaerobaculia bacterium]